MATPYSTIAQLRLMCVKAATDADITDANVTAVMVLADKKVREDLSNILDMDAVDLAVTTPDIVSELSRFKTCEWVLVKLFGPKRTIDTVSDIQYWAEQYKLKLEQVQMGVVDLGPFALGTQAFSNSKKKDVLPALGHGKYAGFLKDATLEDIRVEDTSE